MPSSIGATGYIGGDLLYEISHVHPEYEISCLVRNSDKGAKVASQYAHAKLVYGGLDSTEILEEECAKADIVVQCADADHVAASQSIIKGLATHPATKPGYFIHTSGTGVLIQSDIASSTFGEPSSTLYNDWDGLAQVKSLPDASPHRAAEKAIWDAAVGDSVKTAIISPGTIYGKGRGPDNTRSAQLPQLAEWTLKRKSGVRIGAGESRWNNVHVRDLSTVFLLLVEAAAAGGGEATWGPDAYYFAENGEHGWGELGRLVAAEAHRKGYIPSDEVATATAEELAREHDWVTYMLGTNSRCGAVRARKVLGWKPREGAIESEVGNIVESEAKRLGIVKGHAAQFTA